VEVLATQGKSIADAVRAIGTTVVNYYRWRKEYGGLKPDQVRKLKKLEAQNVQLRQAVFDLTLDKMILFGGGAWKLLSHARHHHRQSLHNA